MPNHVILITIGGLLLAGLAMDELGQRTKLPRVTLLVLLGVAVGPSGFNILPVAARDWDLLVSAVALVMVAFLLGGKLTRKELAENGVHILGVSAGAVVITAAFVGLGLWLMGVDPILAIVLAGVSTATDPAATQDVVNRSANRGPFSRILLGVVAIDDGWGLILFSLLLILGHSLLGQSALGVLEIAARELGGAIAVGLLVGLPAAYLTGRLRPGQPSQSEALGVVLLCGGLALAIGASFLLAAMIAGLIIANLARHHARAFHEIEHIEWPFMVLFFVLAGASLDLSQVPAIGLVGGAYMILRFAGRIVGGWAGGRATGLQREYRWLIGASLMPQAGVAMGMALLAASAFPQFGDDILAIAVGTTIVFELTGPLITQWVLSKVDKDATTAT